ncbi:MAG: nucleoside-diphosphate kinase [Candidatus Cloacimonetes bacterium]|nr:nucleoside-diphosphate kinase [Candidatus Cloacimonadota bacterium]
MEHNTLLIIKPNATAKNKVGAIIKMVEDHGFIIERIKMFRFDEKLAKEFYTEHIGKPFFGRLMEFMLSGTVVGVVLHRDSAVPLLRELIGNTIIGKAKAGTIRYLFADTSTRNAVHASDSIARAKVEIELIFPELKQENFS